MKTRFMNIANFCISVVLSVFKSCIDYEPADLTVHPPPKLSRVGSFVSHRCLVFPKNVLKGKPVLF